MDGVPEIQEPWDTFFQRKKVGELNADEEEFFGKWVKLVHFLSSNPRHPGLNTHEIDKLSVLFGIKIFEAYLENTTPAARRMFWAYGPDTKEITLLAVEHQPDPNKKHAYKQIRLSSLPRKAELPPTKKTQKKRH